MMVRTNQIAAVALLKFLPVFAVLFLLALIFAVVSIVSKFRARAMRDLAAKWDSQYIDPPASRWFSPSHLKILFRLGFPKVATRMAAESDRPGM
jgi:hypothetical protein